MTDEADRLHDYLDGRLGETERRAFEERLRTDPELARRVAFFRELGSALRDAPVDVPPDLARRARARFEASRSPRRVGGRSFSWEVAGLVAAAVVVAAILLPWDRDGREIPDATGRVLQEPASPPAEHDARSRDEGAAAQRLDDSLRPADSARPAPPPSSRPAPKAPRPAASAPAPPAEGSRDALREQEAKKNEVFAKTSHDQDLSSPALAGRTRQAATLEAAATGTSSERVRCETLPATTVLGAESPIVISDPEQQAWRELRAGPGGISLDRLHPDFRSERVVIVGPAAAPLGCDAATLVDDGANLRIRLIAPAQHAAAAGGCAIVIPAGSTPVVLEDPSDVGR